MRAKIDFDVVRKMAAGLGDVEESTIHGAPSLKVGGKLLACPAIHKSAEPNTLAVRIGIEQRERLLAAEPGTYYLTDHYLKHPVVLVRMSQVSRESLRELLGMARSFVSSRSRKG